MNKQTALFIVFSSLFVYIACTSHTEMTPTVTSIPIPATYPTYPPDPDTTPALNQFKPFVSDIVLTPQAVTNLAVVEMANTTSTQNQLAVIWADNINGKHIVPLHVGLLDVTRNQISKLKASINNGGGEGGIQLIWSPDGTRLIYHLRAFGSAYVTAFPADNSTEAYILNEDDDRIDCEWAPYDGRYIACYKFCDHTSAWMREVFNGKTGQKICTDCTCTVCGVPMPSCPSLPLADGESWKYAYPAATPESGQVESESRMHESITQACQHFEDAQQCIDSRSPSPDKHLAVIEPRGNGLFIVDTVEQHLWKVSDSSVYGSYNWSADSRYLAWIESAQLMILDTKTRTTTPYVVPGTMMLNAVWSPLRQAGSQ